MATYAAKSGGQNFTDTWATVDTTSENSASGTQGNYAYATTSYVASSSFTPNVNTTIDGVAVWVTHTTYAYSNDYKDLGSNKFYVRLAQAGSTVAGTECYIEAIDLIRSASMSSGFEYTPAYSNFTFSKALGGWFFFKFSSPVTLSAATAYTVDVKMGTTGNTVMVASSSGTNWLRYLRTTTTNVTPGAGDRLIVSGEISPTGTPTTVTVTHDSTSTTTTYGKMEVGAWGEWVFPSNASTAYYFKTSADMRIMPNGALKIGTSSSPLPSTSSVTFDFQTSGIGWFIANRGSKLEIYGQEKTSRAYLSSNISASATAATVTATQGSSVDPAWKNGDEVIFAAASPDGAPENHWNKWDIRTLTANSNGSGGLSFAANTYLHDTNSPWVANVTRAIKFIGKDASTNSLAVVFFTDDIYCKGVQFYNLDYVYMHNYDGQTRTTFQNCTFGKVNTNRYFATYNLQNFEFNDCIFHQTASLWLDQYSTNRWPEDYYHFGDFNNCMFIAQTWQPGWAMVTNVNLTNQSGVDFARFNNCVWSSNNNNINFIKYSTTDATHFKDCIFDVHANINTFYGLRSMTIDSGYIGTGKLTISNCTFLDTVNLELHNIELNDCTIVKRYTRNSQFVYVGRWAYQQYWYDRPKTFRPLVLNNCTLSHLGATKTSPPTYCIAAQLIFNGGSINITSAGANAWAVENGEVTFNNVAFPNLTLTNSSKIETGWGSFVRFNKFNQVDNDHRMYSVDGSVFTDSSTYDSAPRSMLVKSNNPTTGIELKPIKIPTKANTSTTISFKVKPSEYTVDSYGVYNGGAPYNGEIPSLVIKRADHLGNNFSSDQEILANPADFNGSHGSYLPTDLGSNLRLWLSAKNPADITYDSAGRVSQWNDKSGGNRHLTQSDNKKKPYFRPRNRFETLGVNFTHKKDQGLAISSDVTNGVVDKYTIAMVARHPGGLIDNTGTAGQLFTNFNATKYYGVGYCQGVNKFHYLHSTQTSYMTIESAFGIWGGLSVYVLVHDHPAWVAGGASPIKGHYSFYRGSFDAWLTSSYNPYATDTTFLTNYGTSTGFSLGCGFGSSGTRVMHSPNLEVLEFLYINKALSDTEVGDITKYLCNQYNVAQYVKTPNAAWKTLTYTIPAPTKDCVIEAQLRVKNGAYNSANYGSGYLNIDTLTAT